MAGRHCIDKLRRRKRETASTIVREDLHTIADGSMPSPLSQVLQKEAERELAEQLNRLPEGYRLPLMLCYYQGMSYSEIARALNRRVPAIKTSIFRAKNRLRQNLRQTVETLTPGRAGDRRHRSRPGYAGSPQRPVVCLILEAAVPDTANPMNRGSSWQMYMLTIR